MGDALSDSGELTSFSFVFLDFFFGELFGELFGQLFEVKFSLRFFFFELLLASLDIANMLLSQEAKDQTVKKGLSFNIQLPQKKS